MLYTVTICGSFRKFSEELKDTIEEFQDRSVEVLSPKSSSIVGCVDDFVSLKSDVIKRIDQEANLTESIKIIENSHLAAIQQSDAVWMIAPKGYVGSAASFEIGYALAHNVPVFYDNKYKKDIKEIVLRCYCNPTNIEYLVNNFESMPKVQPEVSRMFLKKYITKNTNNVSVGPLIVDENGNILLVKTHKWNNKFSIVGGKIRHNEQLHDAFQRVTYEQTGLEGNIGKDICAFDEIPNAGYFINGTSRIFIDKVMKVSSNRVMLDNRAEDYVWMKPEEALTQLDIELNAKYTIEKYCELRL